MVEIDEWHPPSETPMPVGPQSFPRTGVNSLASLGARGVARTLDALVVAVPYSIVASIVLLIVNGTDSGTTETMEPTARSYVILVVPLLVLAFLYETVAVTLWGQTLGKLAVGVRVARQVNGRCPLWWESGLRIGLPAWWPPSRAAGPGGGHRPVRHRRVRSHAAEHGRPGRRHGGRPQLADLSSTTACVTSPTTSPACASASTRPQQYLRIDELRRQRPQLETEASPARPVGRRRRRPQGHRRAVARSIDDLDAVRRRSSRAHRRRRDARRAGPRGGRRVARARDRGRRSPTSRADFDQLELRALFTGEYDEHDAICEIHSGEGGTDAQDWAEMLLRMYLRWAERRGFDVELDEVTAGPGGRHLARPRSSSRAATPTACCGPSTACTGSCGSRRSTPRASARPRSPRSRSRRSSRTSTPTIVDRREGPAHRHLPLVGRRRPARQRHRLRGAHHPPAHRHRRVVPERAQPAPEQGPGHADPQGQAGRASSAQKREDELAAIARRAAARWASAARSAPTCCSRTRW